MEITTELLTKAREVQKAIIKRANEMAENLEEDLNDTHLDIATYTYLAKLELQIEQLRKINDNR